MQTYSLPDVEQWLSLAQWIANYPDILGAGKESPANVSTPKMWQVRESMEVLHGKIIADSAKTGACPRLVQQ